MRPDLRLELAGTFGDGSRTVRGGGESGGAAEVPSDQAGGPGDGAEPCSGRALAGGPLAGSFRDAGRILREIRPRQPPFCGSRRANARDRFAYEIIGRRPSLVPKTDRVARRSRGAKLMNERLDDLRRGLVRAAAADTGAAIKGLRWRLLHRKANSLPDVARRLEES